MDAHRGQPTSIWDREHRSNDKGPFIVDTALRRTQFFSLFTLLTFKKSKTFVPVVAFSVHRNGTQNGMQIRTPHYLPCRYSNGALKLDNISHSIHKHTRAHTLTCHLFEAKLNESPAGEPKLFSSNSARYHPIYECLVNSTESP